MESLRKELVLAALLHDIGKFWQRADKNYADSETLAKLRFNQNYDTVVPVYDNGSPKYVHALWTYAFMQQFDTHKYLQLDNILLTNLASRHHQPTSMAEGFIALADRWSSGIDRPDEGEEADSKGYKEVKQQFGSDFVRKVPMYSIFDALVIKDQQSSEEHIFTLSAMEVQNQLPAIFPQIVNQQSSESESLQPNYANLWESFVSKYQQLPKDNFRAFFQSLLNLLKEHTWCIPSATNFLPANVSLFEHLKTTAGLALCLYDHYQDNPSSWDKNSNWIPYLKEENDPVQMVCIKFSGIQKFIYDIASSKAAKSLKGRSFYLQLLMRSIINEVLFHPDINLYPSNIIYASGGKCYLLLPNTERVNRALKEIEQSLEQQLWDNFKNSIYVVFGKVSFRYRSIKNIAGNWESQILSADPQLQKKETIEMGDLWRVVNEAADKRKGTRFLSLLLDPINFAKNFFPEKGIPYPMDSVKCAVTGERGELGEMEKLEPEELDSPFVTRLVYQQTTLGKKLRDGTRLLELFQPEPTHQRIHTFPGYLSTGVHLAPERSTLPNIKSNFHNQIWLNRFPDHFTESHHGYETLFYGGNEMPMHPDETIKSFEELAEGSKLEFLKMDVDNLGHIFIHGFRDKQKNFAAYATLSMLLDAFFGGYINTIRSQVAFKDYVQILYSGGDDLFAIGRWDAVIDFAAAIRKAFEQFTGRTDISISGGVAIVGAKFPVAKAAELASEAEEKAKQYVPKEMSEGQSKPKNAFCFFDEVVSWHQEYDFVKSIKDNLIKFDGAYGKNILHKLQQFKLNKDDYLSGKGSLAYKWHSTYYLARAQESIKNIECKDFISSIRDNILHNATFGSDRYLDLVALGSRWAEYLMKHKSKSI